MYALERNAAERAKRRLTRVGEAFRQFRHKIPVNAVYFSMVRLPGHCD